MPLHYFAFMNASVVSSMRWLNAQSLWLRPLRFRSLNIVHSHDVSLRSNEWDYFAFMKAIVVSNILLLNPHSLSYHARHFTRLPLTLVSDASK